MDEPAEFWENRYSASEQTWSGRPNHSLVEIATELTPGRALDLGCGEGADAIWLARRGWVVTGLDISPTAIDRATAAARTAGLEVYFEVADLSTWVGQQPYDLVTASFLHSPVSLARTEILRHAASLIRSGGHLLVISHAAAPPWAPPEAHEHRFLEPKEEIEELGLDDSWSTVLAEIRNRPATDPEGDQVTLDDGIVLLQRA